MSEIEEIKLEGENIPEKFRGKSVADVLKSMTDTEKMAHDAAEKAAEERKKREELEAQMNAEPESDPIEELEPTEEPEDDDYEYDEYVTRKDLTKFQKDIAKTISESLRKQQDEQRVETNAQFERRQFISSHPELFEGKDQATREAIIRQVAANAYAAGKKTLEEGLEAYQELGQALGMTQNETNEPRVVPTPDLEHGVGDFESLDDELKHMIDYHKKSTGSISGRMRK